MNIQTVIDAGARQADRMGYIREARAIRDIQWDPWADCEEKDNGEVAYTDWNPETFEPGHKSVIGRVHDILERMGYDIEFGDEVTTCTSCGRAVRSTHSHYGDMLKWAMVGDCDLFCLDCLRENPKEYLESLEGVTDRAVKVPHVDPAEHGYQTVDIQFEHGFHPGQTADPKKIGAALKAAGVDRFIFGITEVSQFYIVFTLFVPEGTDLEAVHRAVA